MKKYFLHGMGGSKEDWASVLQNCSGEALEIPSNKNILQTVEDLAEKISPSGSLICGYSMGARLAVLICDLLLERKRPPQTLILLSSGLGFIDENDRKSRAEKDHQWAALARSNPMDFWEKWYKQEIFSSLSLLPATKLDSWMKNRIPINSGGLASQLENLGPANHGYLSPLLDKFRKSGISVLYIVGELDKKYLSEAKRLEERDLAVRIIPNAGHILPLEAPEILAELIRTY